MPKIPALQALGASVRARRLKLGLSQDAFAEKTGLHRTYVGGIERGERNVSLLNICVLADALSVSVSDLLANIHAPSTTKRGGSR